MSDEPKVTLLVKVGTRAHMKSFIERGEVFIRPVDLFKTTDDNYRADEWENSTLVAGGDHVGSVEFKTSHGKILRAEMKSARLYIPQDDKHHATHLFCLSYLDGNISTWPSDIVDPKMIQFGDTLVVILDVDAFWQRLQGVVTGPARHRIRKVTCRAVEYVSDTYSGQYDIFKKRQSYSYQREFRFAFSSSIETPLTLALGDLRDIATLISFESFENRIVRDCGETIVCLTK